MAPITQQVSVFDSMDHATASLILQLQLSDINDLEKSIRDKNREDDPSDIEVAAQIWRQNLESLQMTISDRRMTQSIAQAVQLDGQLVAQVTEEEQSACEDHVLAHQFNGSDVTSEIVLQARELSTDILSKLAGLYVSEDAGEEYAQSESFDNEDKDNAGEPSARAAMRSDVDTRRLNHNCVACQEVKKYFDVIAAPCRHEYCRDCLRDLFAASMTDESLFPPRCCRQPITVKSVGIFLTKELKDSFEKKKVEFGTPNRTYCSSPFCSAFLDTANVESDTARCNECFTMTCVVCKSMAHDGDCPDDRTLQAVLELAEENGWQRCYSCRRVVELDHGCNHITCRCGAHFCYICGERWKTCACAQWNEDRLLARANLVVGRDAPRLEADNPVRVAQVEQAVQMLRHYNCGHASWRYISGPHACEECHHQLPQYIFECRQCRVQACGRCRRNRL